jgi:anti-sigma factor ChrR (cupin superfamily)
MSLLDDVIDGVAETVLKGAIVKVVAGWVAQGYVAAQQAPEMEAGMLDEVQVALKMWQAQQEKAAPSPPGALEPRPSR